MNPQPAITVEHVRHAIATALDHRAGGNDDWQIEGPVVRARHSRIFPARTPLAPWPLAVKAFTAEVTPQAVEQQAEFHARYHKAMSGRDGLTVPALWAALPEHRILIMEWIDDPRIDMLLWWAGPRRDRRAELLTAAGRWLRHFHQQSTLRPLPLRTSGRLKHIDDFLGGEEGAGRRMPDQVFSSAYELLWRWTSELADTQVDHVEPHGDFVPRNLFHGSHRTVGLDFKPRRPHPPLRDIFHFLVQAESRKSPLTRHNPFFARDGDYPGLDPFLAGYGPLNQAADDKLIRYFQLAEVLSCWAKLINSRRDRFVHPIMAARLRRMASHAVALRR
jgi:hypothetical protein